MKLNGRLILIHLLATLCLISAATLLAHLHDPGLTQELLDKTKPLKETLGTKTPEGLVYFVLIPAWGTAVGIVISFLISITLSRFQRWFWLNAVLIAAFCLTMNMLFNVPYLVRFLLYPFSRVPNISLVLIVEGGVLVFVALMLFFSPKLIRFINGKRDANKKGLSDA